MRYSSIIPIFILYTIYNWQPYIKAFNCSYTFQLSFNISITYTIINYQGRSCCLWVENGLRCVAQPPSPKWIATSFNFTLIFFCFPLDWSYTKCKIQSNKQKGKFSKTPVSGFPFFQTATTYDQSNPSLNMFTPCIGPYTNLTLNPTSITISFNHN